MNRAARGCLALTAHVGACGSRYAEHQPRGDPNGRKVVRHNVRVTFREETEPEAADHEQMLSPLFEEVKSVCDKAALRLNTFLARYCLSSASIDVNADIDRADPVWKAGHQVTVTSSVGAADKLWGESKAEPPAATHIESDSKQRPTDAAMAVAAVEYDLPTHATTVVVGGGAPAGGNASHGPDDTVDSGSAGAGEPAATSVDAGRGLVDLKAHVVRAGQPATASRLVVQAPTPPETPPVPHRGASPLNALSAGRLASARSRDGSSRNRDTSRAGPAVTAETGAPASTGVAQAAPSSAGPAAWDSADASDLVVGQPHTGAEAGEVGVSTGSHRSLVHGAVGAVSYDGQPLPGSPTKVPE